MKHIRIFSILLLLASTMLSSCMFFNKSKVEYLPYQEEEGGDWGLISIDGEVLYKEEFSKRPSAVVNDRFTVENEDGLYELYEPTKKKPTRVNKTDYKAIGLFNDDVTPAVEPGKPIDVIDKDGKVKFTFDEVDGVPVTGMSVFCNGYAVFQAGNKYGLVDTDGKVTIPAEYASLYLVSDGKAVGIRAEKEKMKSMKDFGSEDKIEDKREASIMTPTGKELGSFKLSKIPKYGGCFASGVMAGSVDKDGDEACGLLDEKGEWVVGPSTKFRHINIGNDDDIYPNTSMRGNYVTFSNKDYEKGVMDLEGEIVLRAKYEDLFFIDDDLLAAKKKDDDGYIVIDLDGNEIIDDEYKDILPFFEGSDYCFVKDDDHEYSLMDRKGEIKKKTPDIYEVSFGYGNLWVESDYVDFKTLVNELKITDKGILDFTLDLEPAAALKHMMELGEVDIDYEPKAEEYRYRSNITGNLKLSNGTGVEYEVIYSEDMTEDIKERVTESYYGYSYSWDKTVGQRFKSITPRQIFVTIGNSGKLSDKMKDLYQAVKKKAEDLGSEVKSNRNAFVAQLDYEKAIFVANAGNRVLIHVFKGDPYDVDISSFENVKDGASDDSYDLDYAQPVEAATADSVAVAE